LGSSAFLSVILGNAGGVGDVIVNNADNLKNLSYGRRLEKEADLGGLKILSDRKIDGSGFVGLFTMLKKQNQVEVVEWMSSHPDLEKRMEYIRKDPAFNKNGVAENEALKTIFLRIKTSE
jgi:predicted Zn-dependent protease